ncbi:MAG TPA: helix-turn-helix transcriptional regulator [Actinomycetota bacterium]|nr:helix-turn-helix transcriptional regulator [Actinomycetota bacterium]
MTTSSLEIAVLGLLKEGPMHGYEISRRLSTTLGPLWTISFGSLYPCLKRLRKSGMVRETRAEGARLRRKTTYEITTEGETFFFEQLEHGAVYDTDRFRLRFAFFRYLPTESRIGLMERRRAYLQEKLLEFKESLRSAQDRIDAYSLSLINHGVQATEQDIRWLEELIDQERASDKRPPKSRRT